MEKKPVIGGMAVIEGVMMRGPVQTSLAVRKADGNIEIEKEPVKKTVQNLVFFEMAIYPGNLCTGRLHGPGDKNVEQIG
jgi:uncharacterized protein YqhQ